MSLHSIELRRSFVLRFVAEMDARVSYKDQSFLFYVAFIGLPLLFVGIVLPLHAVHVVSSSSLLAMCAFSLFVSFQVWVMIFYKDIVATSECLGLILNKREDLQYALRETAHLQWEDDYT